MKENLIVAIAIVVIVGAGIWFWEGFHNYQPVVESFEDCLKLGYPTKQGVQRTCKTPDGKTFIEKLNIADKFKDFLQIKEIKVGDGEEAKNGDHLVMNYLGTLVDGTKFDSSYDRGTPFEFVLGAHQVIPGWDFGILGMKVGGKRKLTIAPVMAYGDRAVGNIPANSTLVFEVELLDIKK